METYPFATEMPEAILEMVRKGIFSALSTEGSAIALRVKAPGTAALASSCLA